MEAGRGAGEESAVSGNDECRNPNDEEMTQSELQTQSPRRPRRMSSSFVLRPYFVILAFVISHSLGAQQPYKKAISVGEPPPDHSPEAELASFKVLDGFEVNLFASEKERAPTQ